MIIAYGIISIIAIILFILFAIRISLWTLKSMYNIAPYIFISILSIIISVYMYRPELIGDLWNKLCKVF